VIVKKSGGGIAAEFRKTEDAHYAKLITQMLPRVGEKRRLLRARNCLGQQRR
jgi:hypothetical protein